MTGCRRQTAHVDVTAANTFTVGMQLLLATACGLLIASLYYAQPLTGLIAESLGMPVRSAGLLVTVADRSARDEE